MNIEYKYQCSYNEFLDEVYPEIQFGILTYSPSEVLYAVDEIAYREGYYDFLSAEGLSEDFD